MERPARHATCCFSGYRPEKMPPTLPDHPSIPAPLYDPLCDAIRAAHQQGCTHFLSGMSRGFDLWAAQAVLLLRRELPLHLVCILPCGGQSMGWETPWRAVHDTVCTQADAVYKLAPQYYAGCFHARNRFLADVSARLICYFDGHSGGTKYTVRYATAAGLAIDNLADAQLTFATLLNAPQAAGATC